jgi:FKBP-type peptidyl-prolyl cis-trans isomerase
MMKKLFVIVLILASFGNLCAQTNPIKSLLDSASYLVGVNEAKGLKQEGVVSLNTKLISTGCLEASEDKPGLLNEVAMNNAMSRFLAQSREEKAKRDSGKTVTKPVPATTTSKSLLNNFNDSASYIVGFRIGSFYKKNYDIEQFNASLVALGFNDIMTNKPTLISESLISEVMNKLIFQILEEKAKVNIEAGKAFLAQNKLRPEVKTTASGLQYEVIREGTGVKPAAADTFVAHYRGTLLDGTEFDASYNRGAPLTLPVTSVIKGWTEGLQLMPVGSKYKFYIPYDIGYGTFGNGAIPGGATLVFEVELLDVKKDKSQANIEAGEAFLAQNKLRPEVKTTASGLQYEVVREGTGAKPTAADTFVAHYRGTLLDGTEFDASYNRGTPLTLPVTSVIRGWTEGLQLMPVGSKYKFYIPYNLGYGTTGSGMIPGGSTLIFEVELLDVKPRQ